MKNFKDYININEWRYKSDSNVKQEDVYKFVPKDRYHLEQLIIERLKENIKEPYLLDIDTSNIKNFADLFSADPDDYLRRYNGINPEEIITLDLSSWKTSNVTSMNGMFYRCKNLKTLRIENFDMSSIQDLGAMCRYCESLKYVDVSKWKIKKFGNNKCVEVSCIFGGCISLEEVHGIEKLDPNSLTNKNFAFLNSYNVKNIPDNWTI